MAACGWTMLAVAVCARWLVQTAGAWWSATLIGRQVHERWPDCLLVIVDRRWRGVVGWRLIREGWRRGARWCSGGGLSGLRGAHAEDESRHGGNGLTSWAGPEY